MHIAGILIAIASAIFWFGRAARGASDVADAANDLRNLPRRYKFKKTANKRGIDLIDSPVEAATILMVCVARLSDYSQTHDGLLSEAVQARIIKLLVTNMQISAMEADELLTQMRWTVKDLVQPDTALAPMTKIITSVTNRDDADGLSDMLRKISHTPGQANAEQKAFINRFRERAGLSG